MKKFSALLLSCALAASLAAPALAAPDYTLEFPGHEITKETLSFHGATQEKKTVRVVHMKPGDVLRYTDNSEYRYLTATFYILFENDPAYAMTATIEAPDGQNGTELAIPDPLSAHKYLLDPTYGYTSEDLSAAKYLLECAPTRFDQETTMFEREEPVYVMVDTAGSSTAEPAEPAAPAFTDVAENAYYAQPVAWAVTEGITAGKTDTTFAPNETCTTAHILTFLWRAMGSPEPTIENPFTDVTESNYYYKAALWAHEKELVSGNVFTASAPCTRGQTMLFLYLLAGSPAAEPTTFTDVAADSVYNRAISWAVTEGITAGKTADTFDPDGICTRGNIVTFLYRALAE